MKRLLSVTGFTALLTLMRMCSGLIIAKVVAINAGPTGMAMLGQLQSLVSTLNGLSSSSVGSGLVRYTAENKDAGFSACAPWWCASVNLAVFIFLLLLPTCFIFSKQISVLIFHTPEYYWLIWCTVLALPLSVGNSVITSVLNGFEEYRKFILLGMVSLLISTMLIVVLTIVFGIKGALISASLGTGISGLVLIVASLKSPWFKIKYWWGEVGNNEKKKIFSYVMMAITSAIFGPLSLICVRNIIVSHDSWDVAGQWQSVYRISEVYLAILTSALGTYFLPKLAKCKSNKEIQFQIRQTILLVLPTSLLLSSLIYLFRDVIISILFTDSFRGARDLFFYQLIGDVFKICAWVLAFPLLSKGMTKVYIFTEIISNTFFVILSFIFIKYYDVQGANIAYSLNCILYFLFILLYMNKKLKTKR